MENFDLSMINNILSTSTFSAIAKIVLFLFFVLFYFLSSKKIRKMKNDQFRKDYLANKQDNKKDSSKVENELDKENKKIDEFLK